MMAMRVLLHKMLGIVRSLDWWLVVPVFFLLTIGLVMQYSIGLNQEGPEAELFTKQTTFVTLGLIMFFVLSFVDVRSLNIVPLLYYGCAIMALVGVLLFGTAIRGTTGWFVIGSFSMQPVEFVKILVILFLAGFFTRYRTLAIETRIIRSGILVAVLLVLILLQPDLGSTATLFAIWFGIVLMFRPPKRIIFFILALLMVTAVAGWFGVLQDYQKDRITVLLNPSVDVQGSGYNITQSIVAVGSGGVWGRGLGLGTQSQLHFLPEVASDFIFAVIAEELGFVGVVGVLGAIGFLCGRLWFIVVHVHDYFSRIVASGILMYLFVQSVFTMGMNIGLLPVTGLPLPLVSAGGSSMLATLFLLGMAHSLSRSRPVAKGLFGNRSND